MIADLNRRGVRVLFPMMMWDQGTRQPEQSWSDEIANLMAKIGADGINGDAQDGVPLAFSRAAVTNVEFKKFMDAAHYHPKDNLNFLRDWEPFRRGGRTGR